MAVTESNSHTSNTAVIHWASVDDVALDGGGGGAERNPLSADVIQMSHSLIPVGRLAKRAFINSKKGLVTSLAPPMGDALNQQIATPAQTDQLIARSVKQTNRLKKKKKEKGPDESSVN